MSSADRSSPEVIRLAVMSPSRRDEIEDRGSVEQGNFARHTVATRDRTLAAELMSKIGLALGRAAEGGRR